MTGGFRPRNVRRARQAQLAWLTLALTPALACSSCGQATSDSSAPPASPSPAQVPVSDRPHGLFVLNPPASGNLHDRDLVPALLCHGPLDPFSTCQAKGAGFDAVKGATFQIHWNDVQPTNGPADWSAVDAEVREWAAAGKQANLIFQAAGYGDTNSFTPRWYETPVAIVRASQTSGSHAISLQTASAMGFFVGSAAGQWIQLKGTNTTPSLDGTYPVLTFDGANHLTALGIAANDAAGTATAGTAGNPMYGAPCASGNLPVQWSPNFVQAWQSLMQQAVAHFGSTAAVGYLRFGLGLGGENTPTRGTEDAACQALMTSLGFTDVAAPWPAPDGSAWPPVAARWVAYQKTMSDYLGSLRSAKLITFSLSEINHVHPDESTPDAAAASAVAAGLAIGNQGWRESDSATYASGGRCSGDYCRLFDLYRGQVPFELQSVLASNPPPTSGMTGGLVAMFPFAMDRGAQILEIYLDDWLCTFDSGYSPPSGSGSTHATCVAAGYPAAFTAAAAKLN